MTRPAPFSLRLTPEERSQLETQAGAMPLASYIKSVVLADEAPKYRSRRKPPVAEQQLLAEVLGYHNRRVQRKGVVVSPWGRPDNANDTGRNGANWAWARINLEHLDAMEKTSHSVLTETFILQ